MGSKRRRWACKKKNFGNIASERKKQQACDKKKFEWREEKIS